MPIIITAPTVKAERRALISDTPRRCKKRQIVPPAKQPMSAARNGIQANIAICLRSKCRTWLR